MKLLKIRLVSTEILAYPHSLESFHICMSYDVMHKGGGHGSILNEKHQTCLLMSGMVLVPISRKHSTRHPSRQVLDL